MCKGISNEKPIFTKMDLLKWALKDIKIVSHHECVLCR